MRLSVFFTVKYFRVRVSRLCFYVHTRADKNSSCTSTPYSVNQQVRYTKNDPKKRTRMKSVRRIKILRIYIKYIENIMQKHCLGNVLFYGVTVSKLYSYKYTYRVLFKQLNQRTIRRFTNPRNCAQVSRKLSTCTVLPFVQNCHSDDVKSRIFTEVVVLTNLYSGTCSSKIN